MAFAHGRKPSVPTEEELAKACEMADAGLRLALPHLFEQPPEEVHDEAAAVDHGTAAAIASDLLSAQRTVLDMGLRLPLAGHQDLHLAFNRVLNELDEIGRLLSERWGEK